MALRKITLPDDGFRVQGSGDVGCVRRNFVPPVPVGAYVVVVFRVEGYGQDCDGGALPYLANVTVDGETTGWRVADIGIGYDDGVLTVDHPSDLLRLAEEK
jgi:hypothetical protein